MPKLDGRFCESWVNSRAILARLFSRPRLAKLVLGAIKAGVEFADLHVRDGMSDDEAVAIYTAENATHRGESSTAGTGSVAAATWLLVRKIIRGDVATIVATCSAKASEVLQGQIAS